MVLSFYDSQSLFTKQGLCLAVSRALGATAQLASIRPDIVKVFFTGGNYGDGPFDGHVCLNLASQSRRGALDLVNYSRNERFV